MLTPDSKNYNHSYIKAKEAQAMRRDASTGSASSPRARLSTGQHGDDPLAEPLGFRPNRLPPGQVKTDRFPILDLGVRPTRDLYPMWKVTVEGLVEHPVEWTLDELRKLGEVDQTSDFHCVTRWSAHDVHWSGIPFQKILEAVQPKPEAKHVIFHSFDGYTTNVPLEELRKPNVLVALKLEAKEIPPYMVVPSGGPPGLSPEHGGPVRMVIPHLYGWKSAKFLTMIRFVEEDEPGFWEVRGYNNNGDPWLEERYS